MESKEIKEKLQELLEKEMFFSAKLLCEHLLKTDSSVYWKFQYANILRLCTLYLSAEEIFLQINIEEIPESSRYFYHLYLGHLFMDIGKSENAKRQFKKCMEYKDCDTIPYIYMASILLGEENNDQAIDYLKEALNRKGDIDEVYYNLATRLAVKNEFELALDAINNCLQLDPAYPNAQLIRNDLIEHKKLEDSFDK